jgi:hypothetical protein
MLLDAIGGVAAGISPGWLDSLKVFAKGILSGGR